MADPQAEKSNGIKDEEDLNNLLSFAQKLDSFAETLPKSERLLLATIIINLMDPIERMKWRDVTNLLNADEIQLLKRLQSEGAQ